MLRISDSVSFFLEATFWVSVIFVFTNVNTQLGVLLLIQSSETNVQSSDGGEMFKQGLNACGT